MGGVKSCRKIGETGTSTQQLVAIRRREEGSRALTRPWPENGLGHCQDPQFSHLTNERTAWSQIERMNKHLRCLLWILVSCLAHYQAETRPDWDKHAAARSGAEARRLSATACVSLFLPQPLLLAWGGGGCMRICICLSSVSRKMAFVPVPRNLSLSDLQVPRLIDPPNRPGRFLRLSCLPLNSSLSATDMAFALHPGDYRARMRASVERVCL